MPRRDSDLEGIIILNDSAGLITECQSIGVFPTTASKFATACVLQDKSSGKVYRNSGTTAVPVWSKMDSVDDNNDINISYIQVATVALTAAQINGMYAAPVVVVPAVTGKVIFVDSVDFDLTGTATQFAAGGVVNVQYDSTANGAGTAVHADIAASVVTGATARVLTHRINKDLSAIATASITSKGLYISNQTQAFTTGTGTATVTVRYHLV